MKKYFSIGAAAALLVLASCGSQEVQNVSDFSEELLPLQIETAIAGGSSSRSSDVKDSFVDGDVIGFFAFASETLYSWTYSGTDGWEASAAMYWPTKSSAYDFYAFYPYDESAVPSNVPMPDLSEQTGTYDEAFDFIAASNNCSYSATSSGKVSFSGDNAFKHAYSMLSLDFTNGVGEELTLNTVTVSLDGMLTQQYYDFTGSGACMTGESVDEITFTPSSTVDDEGSTSIVLLTNAVSYDESTPLTVTISYSHGGTDYSASASASVTGLAESTNYYISLAIAKNTLSITDLTIDDWEEDSMDNVTLIEEEATDEEN